MPLLTGYGAMGDGGLSPLSGLLGGGMRTSLPWGRNSAWQQSMQQLQLNPWAQMIGATTPFGGLGALGGALGGLARPAPAPQPQLPGGSTDPWGRVAFDPQYGQGAPPPGGLLPMDMVQDPQTGESISRHELQRGLAAPYSPETDAYKAYIRGEAPLPAGWTDNSATGGGIMAPSYRGENPPPGWTPPRFQTLGGAPQTLQSLYSLVYPGQRRFF